MLVPKLRFKREDGTDYPEWRYARADKIAEINPKTSDLPNRFYYMDLGSVSRGVWQEKTITDKDNAPSRANRLASVGDVFFQSVRPYNMGHFFFEEEYEYPVVASTGFIQLRATQEYYNGFIYQLLYEDRFNAEVNIRCTGSNYPAINSENFSDIEMLFPCLEEQQKIADFLATVDEVIAQSEAEVQNLEQQKKAAMQKIFSQEVRFKREDGTDYPEWEEKALSDISEFITKGTTPKKYSENGGVNFVQINSIVDGAINTDKCLRIDEETHNGFLSRSVLFENDILCSIAGALGVIAVVNKDVLPANTNQALAIIRLNEGCNHRYIAFALSSYVMEKYIKQCKTVGAQPNLSLAQIRDMIVPFPCLKEQQKIADFLSAYDEAISYAKQELDKWKELKKGLLQQMLV